MLKPDNEWKWYFDNELNTLSLDFGQDEKAFCIGIERKNLIADAFSSSLFSVEDASYFSTYSEAIEMLPLPEQKKCQLVLNAVAARRFHKPFLPKSWFFHAHQPSVSPEEGRVIELVTELDSAQFIVIENSGTASLCMLAQTANFELSENKTMQFCDTIKVMNDRIFLLEQKEGMQSLALVS